MYCDIHNGALSARISSRGAQLVSLKLGGEEYVWPGGPEWGWQAPVCCPWCGAMEGGAFIHGGVRYAAPRHGFVREAEHTLLESGQARAVFALDVPGGDARWPWPFALRAEYRLGAGSLELRYSIANTGAEAMPIQLGFHPGFIAPAGSAIRAEKPELPGGAGLLALTPGLFDAGSIDLAGPGSGWFRLERGDGRAVTVDARGYPYVLLWGAPGATPFACIEPWSGYPGPGGPSERPGAEMLGPGGVFTRALKLEIE